VADTRLEQMAKEFLGKHFLYPSGYVFCNYKDLMILLARVQREERERCEGIVRETSRGIAVRNGYSMPWEGACDEILRRIEKGEEGEYEDEDEINPYDLNRVKR
jgi:hypothetical protein